MSQRPRSTRARWSARWFAALALTALALAASTRPAAATCDAAYTTRLGPPAMAQPNGGFQTVTRDCTGIAGCSDYFDINLEAGDTLYLTFCANGGSANFDTDIGIRSGFQLEDQEDCVTDGCGTLSDVAFVASETRTYRVRIGHEGDLSDPLPDGNYTLAYSAPAGRTIVPASCGNGALDAGEECDDGNDLDGDCCSTSCTFEAPMTACADDGNTCTDDRCDGAGTCDHPNTIAGTYCYDGEGFFCTVDTCDGAGSCTHTEIPGCNMLPACGTPQPTGLAAFPHPQKALKMDMSLVQAFVGCNTVGGGVPNATTETGTVPSCFPAETDDEHAGSLPGGWHWSTVKAYGSVQMFARCPSAGDVGIKLRLVGITDENGAAVTGDGTFALTTRLTLTDPAGPMTTVDLPLSFGFHVVNGVTKIQTSLNAMLTDNTLPPLPNGTSFEFGPVDPFDTGLFEVRDSNGTPFARPGVYLP